MKKLFTSILLLLLTISIFSLSNIKTKAIQPLDRIDLYQITIDPREDATLDMHFKIHWTVLDSSTEGPLEWVKVGVPNYHVDEIKGLTDNIKEIQYFSEGGSYIRIDFDKKYYQGESVQFEFSTHQSRMYNLNEQNCYFNYMPGWFDEIRVSKAKILWNMTNVINHNSTKTEGNYLVWEKSLDFGEIIKINIVYSRSSFINLSPDQQYTDAYMTPEEKRVIIIVIAVIVVIFIVVMIVIRKSQDPYLYERGFYGRRYYWWFRPRRYYRSGYNSHGSHVIPPIHHHGGGSGGSCACACACACAGGGRAGCSRKDFYDKKLKIEQIKKVLNK